MAATESCRGTTSCPAVLLACITLVCSARLVACQEPAPESTANQQCFDIGYTTLARSGLSYGDYDEYGRLTDYSGLSIIRPVPADDNFTEVLPSEEVQRRQLWTSDARLTYFHSNNPDFPSVHEVGGKAFVINHFEYPQPSTAYISELQQDPATKELKVVNTTPIDDRSVNGMWFMCRGEKTPWGTHMGSEEYPPDCRAYELLFLPCKEGADLCGYADTSDGEGIIEFARYYGYYNDAQDFNQSGAAFGANPTNLADFKTKFSCYNYGASPEISVTSGDGTTSIIKWRTLGRISHETAWFMPDNRTIYTTDDGTNGVMLKFIADRPADLSSGTLYAAEFKNKDGSATKLDINWVELGSGNQADLDAIAVKPSTTFSMMFDAVNVTADGACPEGFYPSNAPVSALTQPVNGKLLYVECLRIKPGMENYAAFLETRRVAAIKGATTEFEKMEGITYDYDRNKLYIAISSVDRGMLEGSPYDGLGPDHLRLKKNPCGFVMDVDLDDKYVATQARVFIQGSHATGTDANNTCDVNNISGPDNLFYQNGNLLIGEDTSGHLNNALWAYNFQTGVLSRILSSPRDAEVTGITLSYVGDQAYYTFAIQHPLELDDGTYPRNAQEKEETPGYLGYIGPLPVDAVAKNYVLDFAPGALEFPARTKEEQERVLAADRVCILA